MEAKSDESTKENCWQYKNGIRSQQISKSCGIQSFNEWLKRRSRGEWNEYATRVDAEKLVKIPRDNISARRSPRRRKEDGTT